MNVTFYKNTSPKEAVSKTLTDPKSVTMTLKSNCSVIDPAFVLHDDISHYVGYNYMYVPSFNRYYYINNIQSLIGGVTEISAHVDVLNSYKDIIYGNEAIVARSEKNYQLYIDDGVFRVYSDEKVVTKKFPNGFTDFQYYLAIAGA